jgi:sporulation protein YunB
MNIYKKNTIKELIFGNSYVGRGIIVGKTPDGTKAVSAYFIMGRSANSRNRIFTEKNGAVLTEPFDASKVVDPSLIIYRAIRKIDNKLIVTNGDQTDTIYDGFMTGLDFKTALEKREFEPDAPNLTPRISAVTYFNENDFDYENVIKIEKNNLGDIVLISADNVKINSISRNIINLTKNGIVNSIKDGIPIPWLSFLGIGLISGCGKNVYIKTVNVVSVDCEFVSNFESKGINQTLHSIYVNVSCMISVDVPLNNEKVNATSSVLLCESVLLGKVPDYYLGKNVLR